MTPQIGQSGQNFDLKSRFLGYLSPFRAVNTHKSRPLKAKNNTQSLRKKNQKQLRDPNNRQNTGVNLGQSVDFWVHFRSTSSNIALLEKILEKKSFPQIAKHILKKK